MLGGCTTKGRGMPLLADTPFISQQWFIVPHLLGRRQVLLSGLSVGKLELMDQTQPAMSMYVTREMKNGFPTLNDCTKYSGFFSFHVK